MSRMNGCHALNHIALRRMYGMRHQMRTRILGKLRNESRQLRSQQTCDWIIDDCKQITENNM